MTNWEKWCEVRLFDHLTYVGKDITLKQVKLEVTRLVDELSKFQELADSAAQHKKNDWDGCDTRDLIRIAESLAALGNVEEDEDDDSGEDDECQQI